MPKNVGHVLVDLDGKPMRVPDSDKPATVGFVAVAALLATIQGDQPTGDEKAQRYALALRLHKGGEHEFDAEELALIKRLVGLAFGPIEVGQVYAWAKV